MKLYGYSYFLAININNSKIVNIHQNIQKPIFQVFILLAIDFSTFDQKITMHITLEKDIYLIERVESQQERQPRETFFIPMIHSQWSQWEQLGQSEARSQEFLLSLPWMCRGPSTEANCHQHSPRHIGR